MILRIALFFITIAIIPAAVRADLLNDCIGGKRAKIKIKACTEIIEHDKSDRLTSDVRSMIYSSRGLGYYDRRDFDRALLDLGQAVALKPADARLYNIRGVVYSERAMEFDRNGDSAQRGASLKSAISDFDKAISTKPKYAEAYSNRGVAYSRSGDHDQAINDQTQAIGRDPKYAEAYLRRGMAYEGGKLDSVRAKMDFRAAQKLGNKQAGELLKLMSELGR